MVAVHERAAHERAAHSLSLRISCGCHDVRTFIVCVWQLRFTTFFYEANCESLNPNVEKMCYMQLQRPRKVELYALKLTPMYVPLYVGSITYVPTLKVFLF